MLDQLVICSSGDENDLLLSFLVGSHNLLQELQGIYRTLVLFNDLDCFEVLLAVEDLDQIVTGTGDQEVPLL